MEKEKDYASAPNDEFRTARQEVDMNEKKINLCHVTMYISSLRMQVLGIATEVVTQQTLRAKLKLSLNGKEQAMLPMAVVATKLSELKRFLAVNNDNVIQVHFVKL